MSGTGEGDPLTRYIDDPQSGSNGHGRHHDEEDPLTQYTKALAMNEGPPFGGGSGSRGVGGGVGGVGGVGGGDDDDTSDDSEITLEEAKRQLKMCYARLPASRHKAFDDFVFDTMSIYSKADESEAGAGGGGARGALASFFQRIIVDRFLLLACLMAFQSLSSEIIGHFQRFIQHHMIVTLFLTMLVGAGGNAGAQSAVHVIRGMATGKVKGFWRAILPEVLNGIVLGLLLVVVGFARVYFLHAGTLPECLAVVTSLFLIVSVSVVMGAFLPLALDRIGLDGAHAGPLIQVVMDIIGVSCTCIICQLILGGPPPLADLAGATGAGAHAGRNVSLSSSSSSSTPPGLHPS